MLRQVVRWCLHRPYLLAWACVWALILGCAFVSDIRIGLMPSLAPVEVKIQTEAPGLVAQQVEETVTDPIESALLGTQGVSGVSSRSYQGLSAITVWFASDADPARVRQLLSENLARVGSLPPGVSAPRVSPPAAPGSDLLIIGFTSDRLDPMALRDLVQWTVRPRLLSTKGVGSVAVYGGQIRRIEVQARPGDLTDSDLGFLDIVRATQRATSVAGAGFIDTPNQRVLIEPHGQADTLDAVKDGQIQTPGADPVRIDDVADVAEAPAPAFGDALIDGKPGILVVIDRALGANTVEATRALDATLAQLSASLTAQGVSVRTDLSRPASFTISATRGMVRDLLIGLALVTLALAIVMRDLRMVLVTLVTVPLTLLAAVAVIKATGMTLNVITLGGLGVALGLVIDDAVIDVESIVSDLRDAESRHSSRLEAILAASLEVRAPVLFATCALALSLVPLLLLPGPARLLLAPLAVVIIVAALVSLVVAIAVTPALALLYLRHVRPARESRLVGQARRGQARWLGVVDRRPALLLLIIGAVAVLALAPPLFLRTELLPSVRDSQIVVEKDAPASSSLDAIRASGGSVARDLVALPGVLAVSQRIGRDPTSNDGVGIEHSVFDIAVAPRLGSAAQAALARRVAAVFAGYPGSPALVRSRFDAGQSQGDGPTSLQINVLGQNLDDIDRSASLVRAALGAMPEHPSVSAPGDTEAPVVRVDLNFNRLALDGLSAADVLDTTQAAFAGETVAHIYDGSRVVDLAVSAQSSLRRDPEAVGRLLVRSTSGFAVPLNSIANVYLSDDRAVITHQDGLRSDRVEAFERSGDIGRFAAAARTAIGGHVALPPNVFLDYQVENSAAEALRSLAWAYGIGAFALFAFLSIAFDGRTAGVILAATVFAFCGGVIAIALMGGVLSIGEMAGLIALVGLSVRSSILLVSRAEDAVTQGGKPWNLATMTGAAGERLVAVIGSAVLIALALAPFAVDAGAPGREIIGPMSIVVIAGVFTSALGNLFVLPLMLHALWRPRPNRRPPGAAPLNQA